MTASRIGKPILMVAMLVGSCLGAKALADNPAAPDHGQGWVASMSSKSEWGGEAQDALTGDPTGHFSFHTNGSADGAWWMVDFQKEIVLDNIKVYNRNDCGECFGRAYSFSIYLAPEGPTPTQGSRRKPWTEVTFPEHGKPFGGVNPNDPKHPDLLGNAGPRIVYLNGKKARYLKLQLGTGDSLHLDKVVITEKKPLNVNSPKNGPAPETDLLGNGNDPFK